MSEIYMYVLGWYFKAMDALPSGTPSFDSPFTALLTSLSKHSDSNSVEVKVPKNVGQTECCQISLIFNFTGIMMSYQTTSWMGMGGGGHDVLNTPPPLPPVGTSRNKYPDYRFYT